MNKQNRSQIGKKKLTRNILIGVAAAVVIALIIFLAVALQRDGAGMTCFRRNATVASADGVKISMIEYRLTLDSEAQSNIYAQYYSMFGMTLKDVQEGAAKNALLRKIYAKEAKALGLTLTKEEQDAAKKEAQDAVDSVETYYKDYMVKNGTYTRTALEKQIADYYRQLGMNQSEYYAFVKTAKEAEYYEQKLDAYFLDKEPITDEAVEEYYKTRIEESMVKTGEDGQETPAYEEGTFWAQMDSYLTNPNAGLLPVLYVPEGFIYTDFIQIEGANALEVRETIRQVTEGEKSFDELMNSDENVFQYREKLAGPYPIAEFDHNGLFSGQEAYAVVAGLEIGEIGSYIAPAAEDAGEEETKVTAYLFRRANGNMCVEGESGLIKIDYISGIRDRFKTLLTQQRESDRQQQWLSDVKFEDALYTYKGALE